MSRQPFLIFGTLLLVLLVGIPVWVFFGGGDPAQSRTQVPTELKHGQELFQQNCGNCHKLYAAGTAGTFGPDLDRALAPAGVPQGKDASDKVKATKGLVLGFIENGAPNSTGSGRMPARIVTGQGAEEVAEFVARTAGRG